MTTGPTLFGQIATDIPEDFVLDGASLRVPNGARYLFVAVPDIFYGDNSDPNGDLAFVDFRQAGANSATLGGIIVLIGGNMRFWMRRTFSYVLVVSALCLWSGCEALLGPDLVEVSPEHPTVVVGATQQFKLTATYFSPTYVEDKTGVTEWSSSNTAVATISQSGLAKAIAPGETLITGKYRSSRDDTRFTVTP